MRNSNRAIKQGTQRKREKGRREREKECKKMKLTKKWLATAMALVLGLGALAGCGGNADNNGGEEGGFDTEKQIAVQTREEGSGTRGAFVELFGVEQKDADGNKVDMTTIDAATTNSTAAMMTGVAGNEYAIGYISLGSLDDSVKALKIDGAEASVESINAGEYKIARPFNVAVKEGISEVAQDFLNFIMSEQGQAVVADKGYIAVDAEAAAYESNGAAGKIVVAGSSSVSPVMEKLKEAYLEINGNATVEILTNDSTTGMTSTIDGTCDIGMASRALKDSEVEAGLTEITIAMDGIAVIVNKANTIDGLTSDQVKNIYVGDTTVWADVAE